jgi:hypothetical protein
VNEQTTAEKLFEQVLDRLRLNYGNYDFFVERDLVWTFQQKLKEMIIEGDLPFEVYNDFPMIKAERHSLCTDLAVLNQRNEVELAIEFKYEPDHQRGFGAKRNIWPSKLSPSVVFWGKEGVEKDVERARRYVSQKKARVAISLFIDEGGLFRHRQPPQGTKWVDWNCEGKKPRRISLLIGHNR